VNYFKKDNGGPASAKNLGAKIAKGRYITFLDSDDFYYNNESLKEFSKLVNSSPDLIAGTSLIIKRNNENIILKEKEINNLYDYTLQYPLHYVGTPPYIFKRKSFLYYGGLNEKHQWGDALAFWRRFTSSALVNYLSAPCYVYDQTGTQSVSRSKHKYYYLNVLKTISDTYEEFSIEIDNRGYTFNWGTLILLLSIRTLNLNLATTWAVKFLKSPLKSTRGVLFICSKYFLKNKS